MADFSDLLASSRQALEDNPFEDPFARPRSASPDPWSNFGKAAAEEDHMSNPFGDVASPTRSESGFKQEQDHGTTLAEPLDVESVRDADDHAGGKPEQEERLSTPPDITSPRTPGFRESISSHDADEEQKTEQTPSPSPEPTPREPNPPPPPSVPLPSSPPPQQERERYEPRLPERQTTRPPPPPSSSVFSSPRSQDRPFVSPLETPASAAGFGQSSFAGLSLGGETTGGWGDVRETTVVQEDSDDDDDRPILETVKKRTESLRSQPTDSPPKPSASAPALFTISVEDPQKVGDPIRGYTMYTVHTKTTSPLYPKTTFSVLRRYSDFLWLYSTLSQNNPGVVVPPVPEKAPFGRFDQAFVQQRRLALEKCINKMANHAVLSGDMDLKLFLESDTFSLDIKHRKAEIAQERGGLIASIGQTLSGPRFYETDEWFDKKKFYLDSLESQLRGLVKAIDFVSKQRTDLAAATAEFALTIGDLSTSDVGQSLSHSLARMADVERQAQEFENKQAHEDVVTILSTVDEYARLINSVRLAFAARVRTYHAWQSADSDARRIKQTHERNRAQGRIPSERLGHSLSHIAEAEKRAMDTKQEFDNASKLIKSEVARFEQERIEDFRDSLKVFLEGMISRQKELIAAWEEYQQTLLKKVKSSDTRSITSPTSSEPSQTL